MNAPLMFRTYVTSVTVGITIDDLGGVTYEFDLSDVDLESDDIEPVLGDEHMLTQDVAALNADIEKNSVYRTV